MITALPSSRPSPSSPRSPRAPRTVSAVRSGRAAPDLHTTTALLATFAVIATLAGCGRTGGGASQPAGGAPTAAEAPPSSRSPVELKGGGLVATVTFAPSQPKVGELFAATTVLRRDDGSPVQASAFTLDATMPSHGHGMMTDPQHTATAAGWATTGMKLHMHGAWKLAIEVTVDGKPVHLEADWQQAPEAL